MPTAVVRPPLDRCVPTGVQLEAGARVILPDAGGVGGALASRLEALGVEVLTLDTALDVAATEEHVADWLRRAPCTGVYWLPALDDEGPLSDLDPAGWREGLRLRVKLLAATMRACSRRPGRSSSARRAWAGAWATTRPARRPSWAAPSAASRRRWRRSAPTRSSRSSTSAEPQDRGARRPLVDETLRDPGAVEIGHADGLRWTVALRERAPASRSRARAEPGRRPSS